MGQLTRTNLCYFVHFRFGAYLKEFKRETNKKLTFRDLAGTETETPEECMLLLEMTRKNQAEVIR